MSGSPPGAAVERTSVDGREVPTADVVAFVNSIVVFFKIRFLAIQQPPDLYGIPIF
jgi:hypothetical protein